MEPGGSYYVESVGKYWLGRVVSFAGFSVTLAEASWVAETGRFHKFLAGEFDDDAEIEPVPDGRTVTVQWLNYIEWPHALPRSPK